MIKTRFSRIKKATATLLVASVVFASPAHAEAATTTPSTDDAFTSIFAGGFTSTEDLLARHVSLGEAMVAQWAAEADMNLTTYADAHVEALASLIGDEAAALDMASNLFLTPEEALAEVKANGFNFAEIDSVADMYSQFNTIQDSVDGQVATTAASVATAYGASWTPSIDFGFTPPEALSFGLLYDEVVAELVANRGVTLGLAQGNTGGQAFIDAFKVARFEAAQTTSRGLSDLASPCLAAFNYATATGAAPTDPGIVEGGCTPCVAAGTYMHQKLVGVMDPSIYEWGSGSLEDAMADGFLTQNELSVLEFQGAGQQMFGSDLPGTPGSTSTYWDTEEYYEAVNAGNCVASTAGVTGAVVETLPAIMADLDLLADLPDEDETLVPGGLLDVYFAGAEDVTNPSTSTEPEAGSLLDAFFPGTTTVESDNAAVAETLGGGFSNIVS